MGTPQSSQAVVPLRTAPVDPDALGRLATALWQRHQELMATNSAYRMTVLGGLGKAARRMPVLSPLAVFAVDVYGTL